MGKYEELLFRILRGTPDANIALDDLRQLLLRFLKNAGGAVITFSGESGLKRKSTCNGTMAKPKLIRCAKYAQ
jgi:hypothetical protein